MTDDEVAQAMRVPALPASLQRCSSAHAGRADRVGVALTGGNVDSAMFARVLSPS